MKFKYATISSLVAASMISACAVQSEKQIANKTSVIYFNYYEARNDTYPEQNKHGIVHTAEIERPKKFANATDRFDFGLTKAIECNKTLSACKYAVVKTSLKYNIEKISNTKVKVSGILQSEIGRHLEVELPVSKISETVPDSIELIDEGKADTPFEITLHVGEKYEVKGLAGVHVDIDFQEHGEN